MNGWEFLNDLGKSLNRVTLQKLSSPFWLPFLTLWLAVYWRSIYITIFVDSDSLVEGSTKLDYLLKNLPEPIFVIKDVEVNNWLTIFTGSIIFYFFHRWVIKGIFGRLRSWSKGGCIEQKSKELSQREKLIRQEKQILKEERKLQRKIPEWDKDFISMVKKKKDRFAKQT